MSKKEISWYARRYTRNFGFHLVPVDPGRKFPRSKDWGNKTISDPDIAEAFWKSNSDWNMGLALGPSGVCSLDIDCYESFSIICDAFGIDLGELIKNTPTIQGKAPGLRLMFRVPDGVELDYHKITWRPESDPKGELHRELLAQAREAKRDGNEELENELREEARKHNLFTVFELRAASHGEQRQDILPPSIHPDTGEPYQWVTQPSRDWPTPPAWLLAFWTEFDKFKPQIEAACPWSVAEEIYKPQIKQQNTAKYNGTGGFSSVIREYNARHSLPQVLMHYGYTRIGQRYLSPHSQTRIPGVLIFEGEEKAWIHHASDPLCSDDSGRPVSAFDLYCYYDHGGDFTRAVKAAADEMGMRLDAPSYNPAPESIDIDPETGEILSEQLDSLPVAVRHNQAVSRMRAVDSETPLPWTDHKNKPLKHHENLQEICARLGVVVRYNVIKKEEEVLIPDQGFSVDNQANAALAWLMSACSLFNFSTDSLQDFVTLIADSNPYNPVATWITSKPWDGVSRLQAIFDTIQSSGCNTLKETLMKRWLLSAVASAFSDTGISARGVLVFQGEQQMGKTAWFKRLVPASLDVIQDGVILRPDDKDSVKHAVSNWLVELGELDATFKRSDIAQLKGFITRDRDSLRMPYARKESTFARRTVFFGSVNPREFLNDPTGNTRFWTIPCVSIDFKHDIDMQQLWAEVYELYKSGEPYNLTPEETDLLNSSNDEYMAIDPTEELLMKHLNWEAPRSEWEWKQATEVLIDAGIDRPTRGDALKAAAFIRKHNGGEGKRINGKRTLLVPPGHISFGYAGPFR